jgi:hypothetical protein
VSDNTDGLPDPTAPYATVMRLIRAHCHPEVEQQAYAALCARAATADPADNELVDPGLVRAPHWRPGSDQDDPHAAAPSRVLAALGRKP